MGRPRGSRNKTSKTNGASKAGNGAAAAPEQVRHDNQKAIEGMTDDERHALISRCARDYSASKADVDAASGRFRAVCKQIKNDGAKLSEVKAWVELDSPEGEQRMRERLEEQIKVARWRNSPVGTQFSMFGEQPVAAASFRAGKEVGLSGAVGRAPENYDPVEWMRGWHEGQAALAGAIRKLPVEGESHEDSQPAGVDDDLGSAAFLQGGGEPQPQAEDPF